MLARAAPGLWTWEQMRWGVWLAQGYALIHAARLMDGERMVLPDPRLSRKGRW